MSKKNYFIVLGILILFVAVYAVQENLLIDDDSIENPEYITSLEAMGMNSLISAVTYKGVSDFGSIYIQYLVAKTDLDFSQEAMTVSLGCREEVIALRSEYTTISEGNISDKDLKKNIEISENTQLVLNEKINGEVVLDDIQKQYFSIGILFQAASLSKNIIVVENLNAYVEYVKELKGFKKAKEAKKLKKATKIISTLPGIIANQTSNLKLMVDIAGTNNIEIPEDVTNLF